MCFPLCKDYLFSNTQCLLETNKISLLNSIMTCLGILISFEIPRFGQMTCLDTKKKKG